MAGQIDGLGNGSSSTSKVADFVKTDVADHDVNYLFGQVAIDKAMIDWSGNCGNLTAVVGSFDCQWLADASKVPQNGIWSPYLQQNISKTIIAHVPTTDGQACKNGRFWAARWCGLSQQPKSKLNLFDPVDSDGDMFPDRQLIDKPMYLKSVNLMSRMINAGIPTIFFKCQRLWFTGAELQKDINSNQEILAKLEKSVLMAQLKWDWLQR